VNSFVGLSINFQLQGFCAEKICRKKNKDKERRRLKNAAVTVGMYRSGGGSHHSASV
jgi:hypothetical protein